MKAVKMKYVKFEKENRQNALNTISTAYFFFINPLVYRKIFTDE